MSTYKLPDIEKMDRDLKRQLRTTFLLMLLVFVGGGIVLINAAQKVLVEVHKYAVHQEWVKPIPEGGLK